MEGIRHPFNRALYEKDERGLVRITQKDGRTGVYRGDGSWVEGTKFDVDPQMCVWISGPRRGTRHS